METRRLGARVPAAEMFPMSAARAHGRRSERSAASVPKRPEAASVSFAARSPSPASSKGRRQQPFRLARRGSIGRRQRLRRGRPADPPDGHRGSCGERRVAEHGSRSGSALAARRWPRATTWPTSAAPRAPSAIAERRFGSGARHRLQHVDGVVRDARVRQHGLERRDGSVAAISRRSRVAAILADASPVPFRYCSSFASHSARPAASSRPCVDVIAQLPERVGR